MQVPAAKQSGGARWTLKERWKSWRVEQRRRMLGLAAFLLAALLVFRRTLMAVVQLALKEEAYSHVLLVPVVSAYVLWLRRGSLPRTLKSSPVVAMVIFMAASAAWLATEVWRWEGSERLSCMTLSFVGFVVGAGFLFLGAGWMRGALFPVAFLFFGVPMPLEMVHMLETASQLASAEVADIFFTIAGTPYVREETVFHLPGITLRVAQECSGIRSSLVLVIAGAVAANLLLDKTWQRWVLVLLVIPLGVVRNAFRILTIGLLCVHVGPEMIDSPIHHRGGPIFFVLSLIPLAALIWWWRRGERRSKEST